MDTINPNWFKQKNSNSRPTAEQRKMFSANKSTPNFLHKIILNYSIGLFFSVIYFSMQTNSAPMAETSLIICLVAFLCALLFRVLFTKSVEKYFLQKLNKKLIGWGLISLLLPEVTMLTLILDLKYNFLKKCPEIKTEKKPPTQKKTRDKELPKAITVKSEIGVIILYFIISWIVSITITLIFNLRTRDDDLVAYSILIFLTLLAIRYLLPRWILVIGITGFGFSIVGACFAWNLHPILGLATLATIPAIVVYTWAKYFKLGELKLENFWPIMRQLVFLEVNVPR